MASLPAAVSPFRVLIVGGSYSGLSSAVNLLDLSQGRSPRMAHEPHTHHPDFKNVPVDITIVDERDGFFHLIGAPLAFANSDYASKAWVKFSDIPALQRPNVHFLQGSVDKVDTAAKQATVVTHVTRLPRDLSYDYMIACPGLRRNFPSAPQSLLRKQYLIEAEEHIHAVSSTSSASASHGVVVIGGGAVGIEMAAELKLTQPHVDVTLVHSRDKLLSSEDLSDACKDKALELSREAGVEVLLNRRVASTKEIKPSSQQQQQQQSTTATSITTQDTSANAPQIDQLSLTDSTCPAQAQPQAQPQPQSQVQSRPYYELTFTDGTTRLASHVIKAVSAPIPSTSFLPPSSLDKEGYVRIRPSLFFEPGDGIENADSHLAAGDAASWSGIKRCGGAMYMGQIAACNVHQRILESLAKRTQADDAGGEETEKKKDHEPYEPTFKQLNYFPPVIGLAVGKKAVACDPEGGVVSGEDVMQAYFKDDLGFTICWNYMQLGKGPAEEEGIAGAA